jgi:hypothetical protein
MKGLKGMIIMKIMKGGSNESIERIEIYERQD